MKEKVKEIKEEDEGERMERKDVSGWKEVDGIILKEGD